VGMPVAKYTKKSLNDGTLKGEKFCIMEDLKNGKGFN